MRYDVNIHEGLTLERFGYNPSEEAMSAESHKMVVVECSNCHRIIEREFRNAKRQHQCPVVEGNKKRCFSCGEWKDLSLFNKCPKLSGGVAKMCRECYNSHDAVKKCNANKSRRIQRSFNNDIEFYFKKRAYGFKNNAKRSNIPFDLDFEYIYDLWRKQDGKCYYSGLPMIAENKINGFQGWQSPSLDRKSPELGYVKGNVVWCCFSINSFKGALSEQEFKNKLKTIQWNTSN